jgi:FSR family fosmidomycin resistance protein-like MFS transporter
VSTQTLQAAPTRSTASKIVFPVLWAVSVCHLLNDMMQALLPAVYPILRGGLDLTFAQVGFLTFAYQLTASLFQSFIGYYTDQRPMPYSLPFGMASSGAGLLTLAFAPRYDVLLVGAMLLGLGSSIFHPESSRIARLASGGSHGLAQALFQVGGNFGSALGPLAAAFFVLPRGQAGLAWFAFAALTGIVILTALGRWYQLHGNPKRTQGKAAVRHPTLSRGQVSKAMSVLIALLFSKYIYLASFTSYYVFFLMSKVGLSTKDAQIYQFVFFAAVAAGTVAGGPIGDKFGRKPVIWVSILGVLPFTLLLPHVGFPLTAILSVVIGFVIASRSPPSWSMGRS